MLFLLFVILFEVNICSHFSFFQDESPGVMADMFIASKNYKKGSKTSLVFFIDNQSVSAVAKK